jgi:rhodanese-related sulfurtransferase
VKLGYKKVKVYAAGYPAWKKYAGGSASAQAMPIQKGGEEGSIAIAQFKEIIESHPESIYLVDVRDKDEFAKGHFKTSVNIPVDDLEKKVKALPSDKPIVFVCSTGARSGESFYMLQDLRPELKKVYYLEAACTWKKDGAYEIKKTE